MVLVCLDTIFHVIYTILSEYILCQSLYVRNTQILVFPVKLRTMILEKTMGHQFKENSDTSSSLLQDHKLIFPIWTFSAHSFAYLLLCCTSYILHPSLSWCSSFVFPLGSCFNTLLVCWNSVHMFQPH